MPATLLTLERRIFTKKSTIGRLLIDGTFECYTLEDAVRPTKVWGVTAIPTGTYEVAITFSDKFQQYMPLLLNVPNFTGIRIHWGNKPEDTEGCILVGKSKGDDMIGSSRDAFRDLFDTLKQRAKMGKMFITVAGSPGATMAAAEEVGPAQAA